jgi:hypothetical protein
VIAENAQILYKEIRQVLGAEDFQTFAQSIARLNSGDQSVEATLSLVGKMLGPNSHLFSRLVNLIQQAQEEENRL